MGQFDYFSAQVINRKNDYSVYVCPVCGNENIINSTECKHCRYSLKEFESVYFSHYNDYNEALLLVEEKKLFSAYEKIITFLEYYPKDVDAQHLRLYILSLLKDEEFSAKAEAYSQEHSDRWVINLIDAPESVSVKDFQMKTLFKGEKLLSSIYKIATAKQEERNKTIGQLKELTNRLYEIYIKVKTLKANKPIFAEIKLFYEKIYMEFLLRNGMNITDYLGRNFNDLTEEEKKILGSVYNVEDKKKPDGTIVKVFMPEIRYNSILLQQAKITVNVHPKKNTQEK